MTALTTLPANFLPRFFGEGNDIRWSEVKPGSGPKAKALEPFLAQAKSGWTQLILPRLSHGRLVWYAMAPSAQTGRLLRDDLLAFVGPSYARFNGEQAQLRPGDAVEAVVAEIQDVRCYTLRVVDPELKDDCRNRLRDMLRMQARRPTSLRTVPRPVGRVLRDFELSTQSGTPDDARGYLDELGQTGQVSARNLAFLEVHLHDAFDNWDALQSLLDDGALVQARRPVRVTRALIRAVYHLHLQKFEAAGNAAGALEQFESKVWPKFSRLYVSLSGLSGPEVVKSFLLDAARASPPNSARRDVLLEQVSQHDEDRPYIEALGALIPDTFQVPPAEPLLEQAKSAYWKGDFDATFELLSRCEPTTEVLATRIRCALGIGTLDAVMTMLGEWEAASEHVRGEIHATPRAQKEIVALQRLFDELADGSGSAESERRALPQNWLEWFERLAAEPTWSAAVAVAKQGADEWSVDELSEKPGLVHALVERLQLDLPPEAATRLSNALPHLMTFFVKRGEGLSSYGPVQRALLDRLVILEDPSAAVVKAAGAIIHALHAGGIGQAGCGDALRAVTAAWKEVPSVDLIDWALDMLESLVTTQSVAPEAQLEFAATLRGQLDRWRDRRDAGQVALFQQLAIELGASQLAHGLEGVATDDEEGDDESPLEQALAGKTVALYSLRVEVLRRTKSVLAALVPNAKVQTFSDKVASAPLASAARNADLFVVMTGAAKHAATDSIAAHRGSDLPTLHVHATGTSSLIRVMAGCCTASQRSGIGA